MRFSVILCFASAVVLLGSMSSFSGCDKTSVSPTPNKNCKKPSTPTRAGRDEAVG